MQQKLLFLIPVYRHNPLIIINEIRKTFPHSEIIIVDDGEGISIKDTRYIEILKHKTNMGLAKSLIDGYERALQKTADYVIKIDADLEYPLYPVKNIIDILNKAQKTSGAYVELKRSIFSNGIIDGLFHIIFGAIEGSLLINKRMFQHSPGLHIYKKETLIQILPRVKKIHQSINVKWGLDLVFLHLANHEGKLVAHTISKHEWVERRSKIKILNQILSTSGLLFILKYYSIINSIKTNGVYEVNLSELAFDEDIIEKDTIL